MKHRDESGYALLTVIFLAAVMLIAASIAVPRALQQGRRQQEQDLIWRGKQYARAVKLFYRKNGRFPTSLEQLTKGVNNVRFLRQEYKDPSNREDGSWRLIYVGPGGQLIGSVKAPPGQQGPSVQMPGAPGAPPAGTQPMGQLTPSATAGSSQSSFGTPLQPMSGTLIGGNIIGVGSKVNLPSIIIYDGGTTYREWEFIWNPAKDPIVIGQPAAPAPGTPLGAPPRPPPRPPQN